MKKILQIVGSLKMGGLETVAVNCMRYADAAKFHFDFLVYTEDGELEEEVKKYGCHIIYMTSPKKGYINFYKKFKKVLNVYGPYDIVHSHTYFNSAIPIMAAKKKSVPYCIAHAHSVKRSDDDCLKKRIVYSIMRKILNYYTDKFCACSEEAGIWVFGNRGFKQKGIIIPNMIDIDKFAFSKKFRRCIRDQLNISEDEFVIGCVGRLSTAKNYYFLLNIFKAYIDETNSVLIIVGDGDLRDNIMQYAAKLNILENVHFMGQQKDIPQLLSAMDVFVLASKHEGLGIVLIEAMANGLRCIVNKNAIVSSVTNLELCETVNSWNIEDWIEKINKVKDSGRLYSERNMYEMLSDYSFTSFKTKINNLYNVD